MLTLLELSKKKEIVIDYLINSQDIFAQRSVNYYNNHILKFDAFEGQRRFFSDVEFYYVNLIWTQSLLSQNYLMP